MQILSAFRKIWPIHQMKQGHVTKMSARTVLQCFFRPKTVAVIGATDRAVASGERSWLISLPDKFPGKVYAVNPSHSELLGLPCYANIAAVPQKIDLAIVVTPAQTVPGVIRECVNAGAHSAIVISAGFKERGAAGTALEQQIQEELRRGTMRLLGPNCLGMMNPALGLNATFAEDIARPGNVAFLSQSGALLTSILDWSLQEEVGFSAIVSTGSMLDLNWGDLISFFGEDPQTRSILLYMESIGDACAFLSAAREVALSKPIIVIKAGRSEAASHAASSHTGALTGSDEVFDAAFRRCGVLRVQSISDLFYMAEVLGKQPRPVRATTYYFDERRRPWRIGDRCTDCHGRPAGAAIEGNDRCTGQNPAAALEPQQSYRRSWRCRSRSLRRRDKNCGGRSQ